MRSTRQTASSPQADAGQPSEPVCRTPDSPGTAPRIDWDALATADRSCCCTARPAVIVIMPATPQRPHRTDLLLCMHHFRVSQAAIRATGAIVMDVQHRIIGADAGLYLTPA